MAIIRNFRLPEGIGVSADYIETYGIIQSTDPSTGAIVSRGGVGVGNSISIGGHLQLFNGSYYTAFVSSASGNTVYTLPASTPATGTSVLQSTSSGVMSWVPMVATGTGAASGFTTLNGLTTGIQYFTTGTSGSGFNISSSGSTHTFNIPIAGSGSTGLITTQSQTIAGAKTFSSDLSVSSSTASTNSTTGSLVVTGGVGIGDSLFVAGNISVNTGTNGLLFRKLVAGNYGAIYSTGVTPSATNYTMITDGTSVNFNGTGGVYFNISNSNKIQVTTNNINIVPTAASTSTSTGALTVGGGVGIGGSLFVASATAISGVTINAGVITGNLTGTATTSTYSNQSGYGTTSGIATTSQSVNTVSANTSSSHYLLFSPTNGGSGVAVSSDLDLSYNPSTNVLTALVFSGNVSATAVTSTNIYGTLVGNSSTATTAQNVNVNATTINSTHYVTFSPASSGSGLATSTDIDLTYNPGTNLLTAGTFSGNLSATAATSTNFYGTLIGNVTGTATTAQNVNLAAGSNNSNHSIVFSLNSTGSGVALSSDSDLQYNPSTNALSVGTGNISANGVRIGNSSNTIDTSSGNLTIDSTGGQTNINDNVVIQGNLTVQGTTLTVDSTVTTIVDPVIVIGAGVGGTHSTVDNNQDRGIEFRYSNSGTATTGFFGFQDTDYKFRFIPNASLTATNVYSGNVGVIVANLEGNVSATAVTSTNFYGTFVGNSSTATTAQNLNINATTINATHYITFSPSSSGSGLASSTDTDLTYNPGSNVLTAGVFSGNVSGTAITATNIYGTHVGNVTGTATTSQNVNTVSANTSATHYITFSPVNGGSGVALSSDNNLTYNPSTNILTADTFSGNVSGTSVTSTNFYGSLIGNVTGTATTSQNLSTVPANTSATHYLLFSPVNGASGVAVSSDSSLQYNPSTNVITADVFSGNLSGTAVTATNIFGTLTGNVTGTSTTSQNINVVAANTNSNHPILFTPASGSASGVAVSTESSFVYNPSTDILSISGLAVTSSTASTSSSTGALVVSGGVGIGGSLYVAGDLTINGTTTTINTVTLTVDDKNIELGSIATPSDVTAEGGGITLKGASDKSINWYTGTGWSSSESWNLVSGNTYKINNTSVLSSSSIGTGITNSSLTALGTITTGVWAGSLITALYGGTGLNSYTKGDLLVGAGTTLIKHAVGSQNQILIADIFSGSGLSWATFANPTYGSFYSTSTQQVTGAGISTPVTFNATYESNRVSIIGGAGTSSRIQIQDAGPYSITFSAQINLISGNQPSNGDFWFRVNGQDIPQSNSSMSITGKDYETLATVNFVYTFANNDYFEIYMSSSDTQFSIEYQSGLTSPPRPNTPSIILSVLPITHIVGASGSGISGILSLNGSTVSQQYFLTGTNGTGFNVSTASGNHTFNIPIAGSGATGLVTGIAQTFEGSKTFSANTIISSSTASTSASTGALTVTGGVGIGQSVSVSGRLQLFNSSNYTAFVSSASGNTVYTLPATTPSTGTSVLQSTSAGVMSWVPMTASGGLAVSGTTDGSIQFKSGSSLGATNSFFFDRSLLALRLSGFPAGNITSGTDAVLKLESTNSSFNGSTNGTYIAVNAGSGFTGDLLNLQVNATSRFRVDSSGSLIQNIGTNSTSTTSGSLQVRGGVGITGSVYVGEIVNATALTQSTSTTSGSLVVSGGAGISASLNVGGITRILSSTASTSPSTGALLVTGGLGVSGQLSFVTAALGFTGITSNPSMAFIGATSSAPITLTVQNDNSLSWEGTSGQLFSIDNNLSSGEIFAVSDISGLPVITASAGQTINLNEFGGYTQIGNGSINSSSTSTGSLVIAGGLGMSGNAYIGGTTYVTNTASSSGTSSGSLINTGGFGNLGNAFIGGTTTILNTTSSTGISSGSLVNTGGFGNLGNAFIGGTTTILSTTSSSGTSSGSLVNTGGFGNLGNAFIGGTTTITNTTASTSSNTGALVVAGGAGIARTLFVGGNLNLTGTFYSGTNTFTKNLGLGDISLDNGTSDTPSITFYWGNNKNLGIDAFYAGSGTTRFRIVRELNESGGAELWSVDRNGIVTRSAWDVGEVINTRVYNNSDLSMSATTTINSTTYTNIATITYTPKSSTSHLWIEFDAHYDFSNGTTTDDFFSRITVGGSAIVEKNQIMVGQVGGGTRSGTIFPISGRYTNSSTSGIAITVQAKWGSADDAIRVYGSSTSGYMRIQEIGR